MGLFDVVKGTLASGVKAAQEGISNIKVDEMVQGALGAASAGAAMVGDLVSGGREAAGTDDDASASQKALISLLWCLASVDGEITEIERQKLEELALTVDENYPTYGNELEQECARRLEEGAREFGHQNAAKIEAQRVIESLELSPQDARLICWDLLALAGADELDNRELDFVSFASEKAGVGRDTFEELRNYSDAILETEACLVRLKASNRSYSEVEPLVEELSERIRTIIVAAQALITDK